MSYVLRRISCTCMHACMHCSLLASYIYIVRDNTYMYIQQWNVRERMNATTSSHIYLCQLAIYTHMHVLQEVQCSHTTTLVVVRTTSTSMYASYKYVILLWY
jgi:hypothetical protein